MPELPILIYILIFTLIGSIISLLGGIFLLYKQKIVLKISHLLISFAAGTLLGTAFIDLLPEAIEEGNNHTVFLWTLFGILIFFLLERFIYWFHSHRDLHENEFIKPTVPLIVLGDSIHNLNDGIAIAATFLVSIPLGIITAFSVAAHEIPQEIGDFAILLHSGVSRKKVFIYNLVSALTAVFGALITYFIRDSIDGILPIVLSLTAGFFIYIASADLIPEIHHEKRKFFAFYETVLLILGVTIIYFVVNLLGDH